MTNPEMPSCAITPTTLEAAGLVDSKVKHTLTVTSDGKWTQDGKFFSPLELYAVVRRSNYADLDFFDFLAGRWAGVVSPTTVTCNREFADGVAKRNKARVRVYSLVSHPVVGD